MRDEFQQFPLRRILAGSSPSFTTSSTSPRGKHRRFVCRVTICTIQRLYSLLRGEELPEDLDDERSGAEIARRSTASARKDVAYNPAIPIEAFDFIVTDECHRSIYNLWRQVLEYFDGSPGRPDRHARAQQTIAFFQQNLVMPNTATSGPWLTASTSATTFTASSTERHGVRAAKIEKGLRGR